MLPGSVEGPLRAWFENDLPRLPLSVFDQGGFSLERREDGIYKKVGTELLWRGWLSAMRVKFAVERRVSETPVLTAAELAGACLSYRHDFGLLDEDVRRELMVTAGAWARAFGFRLEKPTAAGEAPNPHA